MTNAEKYEINLRISKVVRHLLLDTDQSRDQLAELLGCHPKTLGRRLGGRYDWTGWEIGVLARHFGVSVAALYDGSEALMAGVRNRAFFPRGTAGPVKAAA